MDEEKREIKKTQAYTLKPVNIAWLIEQAFNASTPEKRVSASAVLDRLIDEARQKSEAETQSPTEQPKRRKSDTRSTPARVSILAA